MSFVTYSSQILTFLILNGILIYRLQRSVFSDLMLFKSVRVEKKEDETSLDRSAFGIALKAATITH